MTALPACSSEDDAQGPAAPAQWSAEHPEACGLAAYQWRGANEVGSVLSDRVAQTVSAATLTTLLPAFASYGKLSRPPSYDVELHVISYQTQDRGVLVPATALVAVPQVSGAQTLPVYEFLHGTTGFDDGCAISRNAAQITDLWTALSVYSASLGYVSVFPDYIGLMGDLGPSPELLPFLMAEPTAMSSLDAVRAARALVATVEPSLTPGDVVIAGHSQGGHATAVTAAYAPFYAPELPLKAAAYLAPPLDTLGAFDAALSAEPLTDGALALGASVAVLTDRWYGAHALDQALLPAYAAQADALVRGTCADGYVSPLAGITDASLVLTPELLAAIHRGGAGLPPWTCMLQENSPLTLRVPLDTQLPALVVLGENDQLVIPGPQRAAVTELCGRGAQLEYLECSGADHTGAFLQSIDDVLDFFEARLRGEALAGGACAIGSPRVCKSAPDAGG